MFFLALMMGGLAALITDHFLGRCSVKDPVCLVLAVVVGVAVLFLVDLGVLAHF